MDEAELAAVVLALRQLQPAPQAGMPEVSAWQLSARLPDFEFDELRARSRGGSHVP